MKERALRNLRDFPHMPITIEMHKSMWCDDFRNYGCHDLCSGGKLHENPDILNCSDSIKEKVRRGSYNVYPVEPLYYKGKSVSGYVYVSDTPHGMRIMVDEGLKENSINKTQYTGKRHTL
jgi:hypothetical protein